MKIAILSDIHANLDALHAIAETCDEMWVLGDLVNYGPEPAEVVEFIRRHATLAVRGNHDHAIGAGEDPRCSAAFREMARVMQAYTEVVLPAEQKAYLRGLPLTAVREAGGERFFLCHAAPSDPRYTYAPSARQYWAREAAGVDARTLLVGHTHLPFILELDGCRVVNPGSVGQPKHGAAEACYALWEDGAIALKSVPYPVERTIRKLLDLPIDLQVARQLAAVLRNGGLPAQPGAVQGA